MKNKKPSFIGRGRGNQSAQRTMFSGPVTGINPDSACAGADDAVLLT